MEIKKQSKSIYLPGLNGIRAIAVIGVVISHINLSLTTFSITEYSLFGFNNRGNARAWNLGEQGVTMFFVLSGFLITYLLLLEKKKTGYVSRKDFYVRRILRIWPLYFLYLFVAIGLGYLLSQVFPSYTTLVLYMFLLANVPFVIGPAITACHHLWSIAVEEQFYLFWPLFFHKTRRLKTLLIWIILVTIGIRFLLWAIYPFTTLTLFFTINRFDCMMFGGLLAILVVEKSKYLPLILSLPSQLLSWVIIIIHFFNFEIVNSIISLEFVTLATGIIICGQIQSSHKIINLENKFCNLLGKYSYGIYVYHPLLIFLFSALGAFDFIENQLVRMFTVFFSIIFCTLGISYLSYVYLDKYFLKQKHKFSTIKSTNSSNKSHSK